MSANFWCKYRVTAFRLLPPVNFLATRQCSVSSAWRVAPIFDLKFSKPDSGATRDSAPSFRAAFTHEFCSRAGSTWTGQKERSGSTGFGPYFEPEMESESPYEMWQLARRIGIVILCCVSLAAQIKAPERRVAGNVITSDREPSVQIELPKSVHYVGADRWVLYDIADCELHAFVESDLRKNVQRLYWVQFEGYLPTKPDLKHEYDSPRHSTIGGMDFYVDTWVRPNNAQTQKGSDREHIEALVREKGYRMPAGMMYVRLVHLLDEQKRKELMIIYGEDLAPTGLTAADLDKGGKAAERWPEIDRGLIERAEQKLAIRQTSNP